ncbi:MAG: ATP-binding protein, partial [Candidatus Margulisiibacteriota bacterium]
MIFKRKIEPILADQLESKEIIVLTGMRRVGKTTLYKSIFDQIKSDNKVFLDIENPIEQKIFEEKDYNNIWANLKHYGISHEHKAFIFLDEIQAFPEIVKAIKYLYDHYDVKFFLTGSSSYYLKNLFPESLSGRKIVFELFPLDFEEFLIFRNLEPAFPFELLDKEHGKNEIHYEKTQKYYDEYLEYGGFPQVVLAENYEQKKLYLNDIFKSYFEKDVQSIADFRDINAFRDLLLLLLQRVGAKLDISKLSSEIGVSRETIYSYLAFLQGTYFIYLVPPFSRNADREVSGAKKIYICDNGIANQFSKVNEGGLFENAIFLNLKKYGEIRYYQRRSGGEIDFILPDRKAAIEVKLSGSDAELKKLSSLSKALSLKEYYIVSK